MPLSDRLAEMAATVDVLAQPTALNATLRLLAERARELTDADFAAISTFDDSGRMERFIYAGMDEAQATSLGDPPRGRGLLGGMVNHDRPLRLEDVRHDFGFTGWPAGHPQMAAFLAVPMRSGGRTIGSFYMTRLEGRPPFGDADQLTASILALQATVGVVGALVRERESRLSALDERERIAHDLHDGTVEALYALGLQFSNAASRAEAPDIREALEEGVLQINALIGDIRSYIDSLEEQLPAGSPDLARDVARVVQLVVPAGVTTVVNVVAVGLNELSVRSAEDLLYIVREGVHSATRDGLATKVAVDLRQSDSETLLSIQDNGTGFDENDARLGLARVSLRTRAERLGGRLLVIGVPGMGTTVHLSVPRL